MPLLTLLAIAGLFVFRRFRAGGRDLRPLRPLVVGGAVGTLGVITIPFVDQRYLSDFVPLLLVLAGAGLFVVLDTLERRPRRMRVTVAVAAGVLALLSIWVNLGLAVVYQREFSPFTTDPERAAFVRFQRDAPGGANVVVRHGDALPAHPPAGGTLFVVGDCDGVYWTDGVSWFPIERTQSTGRFPIALTLPDRPPGTEETFAVAGPPANAMRFAIAYLGAGTYRFVVTAPSFSGAVTSPIAKIDPGRPLSLELLYDPNVSQSGVFLAGKPVAGSAFPIPAGPVSIAGRDVDPQLTFSGNAQLQPTPANFCHKLQPR